MAYYNANVSNHYAVHLKLSVVYQLYLNKGTGEGAGKMATFQPRCKPLFRSGVHTSYQPCQMAWLVKTLHLWMQLAPLFNSSAILLCNKFSVPSVRLMMSTSLRLSGIQKKKPSLHCGLGLDAVARDHVLFFLCLLCTQ